MKLNEDMELEGEELTVEFDILARCMGCGQEQHTAIFSFNTDSIGWPICVNCLDEVRHALNWGS